MLMSTTFTASAQTITASADTVAMMNLWQTEMLAGNFTNAAAVYAETGVLTVGGTPHEGRTAIAGFFAAFAQIATNVGYTITSVGTDTFSGVYDFGAGGQHDYVINLAPGTADIVSEVVTEVHAPPPPPVTPPPPPVQIQATVTVRRSLTLLHALIQSQMQLSEIGRRCSAVRHCDRRHRRRHPRADCI